VVAAADEDDPIHRDAAYPKRVDCGKAPSPGGNCASLTAPS